MLPRQLRVKGAMFSALFIYLFIFTGNCKIRKRNNNPSPWLSAQTRQETIQKS